MGVCLKSEHHCFCCFKVCSGKVEAIYSNPSINTNGLTGYVRSCR